MSHRTVGLRRLGISTAIACVFFAGGAAAAMAWERFTFSGTMHLNSGGSAEVSGEMTLTDENSFEVNIDTGGADISSGGSVRVTLPDGSAATLEVVPFDGQSTPEQAPADPASTDKASTPPSEKN